MDKAEAEQFAAALTSQAPPAVPEGWFTTREVAAALGRSVPRASHYLREGMESGHVKRKSFRILTNRGIFPVPHYKLTPPT